MQTKEEKAAYHRQYRKNNPDRIKEIAKRTRLKIKQDPIRLNRQRELDRNRKRCNLIEIRSKNVSVRLEALKLFGDKCLFCGINDIDVLQFDHINNDGKLDRHKALSKEALKNPEKFQLLCANCNLKKALIHKHLLWLERHGFPPF